MEHNRDLEKTLTDVVRKSNEYRLQDKCIRCDIDIELNKMRFHLTSDGRSVVFTFKKIAEAYTLFKKIVEITPSFNEKRKVFEEFLKNNGLTIFVQSKHFGILGQHPNKVLALTAGVAGRFLSGWK